MGDDDSLHVSLADEELAAEILLMVNLIIRATDTDGPLSQHEVDRLLGLRQHDR